MRVPTPRLRQVFEHTTHFKVTRPGKNPIVIAKKSLSPKMISRLQSFANGGEVIGEVGGDEAANGIGADLPPPGTTAPIKESRSLVMSPEEAPLPLAPTAQLRPIVETPIERLRSAEEIEALIARNKQLYGEEGDIQPPAATATTPAETVAASATPAAPAPVVVNVNAAPAAPVEKPAPVKAEEAAPKTKEPEAAPEPPAPTMPALTLTQPTLMPAKAQPPSAEMPMPTLDAGLLVPPLASLVPPVAPALATLPATATTAPAAAGAPAPVGAPTVAPEAPAGLALGTATTGKAVSEAMSKGMTLPQAVAATTGVDIQHLPFTPIELKGIEAAQKEYGDTVPKMLVEAAVTRVNGAIGQAHASEAALTAEREQLKAQEVEAAAKAKSAYDAEQAALAHAKELRENAEKNTDVRSFFQSQGMASSVLSLISLAIGGALSGYTGTPNYVLKAFNNALERDLEEQKRRINSRWSLYKDATGSAEAATALYKADNLILTDIALKRAMANQNLEKVGPQLQDTLGKLEQELALNLSKFSSAAAREDYLKELGAAAGKPKVTIRAGAAAKPPSAATELRQKIWETGRTLNIGDVPVKAPGTQGIAGVRDNLSSRNYAVSALEEAVRDVESLKPGESINLLSPERQKALATMALQIENFPQAFGYKRAVSKVAKEQLKEALSDPLKLPSFFKELLGDVPIATGIKQLRDEAIMAREKYIESVIDQTSQRERDAAAYGLWKLRSKEARIAGRAAPAMPKLSTPMSEIEMGSTATTTPVAPSAAIPAAKVFTITSSTGQSRQTADPAVAARFRNQPGFTVVP